MTTPSYPLQIRTVLRSKRRRQAPPFALLGPRRGQGYMLNTGTVPPVFFEVDFRFTEAEAVTFRLWLETVVDRGARPFTMPLRTEFGLLTHTCQLLPETLLPATESGQTWAYSATLMTPAQLIPTGFLALATGLTTDYPASLPGALRATKRRARQASFALPQPEAGYTEAEETGRDRPVQWELDFAFTPEQAQLFVVWFVVTLSRGRAAFRMQIRTEFGLIWHACRFSPDGLLSAQQDGEVWRYSATITARAEVIPAELLALTPLEIVLGDWPAWGALLDQAVTEELPEA